MHETHPEAKQFGPCVLATSTKGHHSLFVNTNRCGAFLASTAPSRGPETFKRCPRRRLPHSAVCESREDGRFSAGGHST